VRPTLIAAALALIAISHLWPDPPTPAGPIGLLDTNTIFAVYGRGFGRAPILGHLGTYANMDLMAADTKTWVAKITPVNEGKGVITGIDLIYALAIPCPTGPPNCLQYQDKTLIDEYIKPAADRGWAVILDNQLGRSNPVTEVKRMIDKGYMKYENVHIALDPEYHSVTGHETPGIPVGTVTAAQINEVQEMLSNYVEAEHLKTKKILIVHQFGDAAVHDGVPVMIGEKATLKTYPNVELVIDADGLGPPAEKVRKYNIMTNPATYQAVHFTGIKVFFPNQWEKTGHFDKPPMNIEQIFGLAPVGTKLKMTIKPNLLIIA
jgi:hypothetical protein